MNREGQVFEIPWNNEIAQNEGVILITHSSVRDRWIKDREGTKWKHRCQYLTATHEEFIDTTNTFLEGAIPHFHRII